MPSSCRASSPNPSIISSASCRQPVPLIARLQHLPETTLVAASCYGTFVLAEAGLLNGLPATTTWWLAHEFQQRYPDIVLDADKTLVDSGRAITAGAMTAQSVLICPCMCCADWAAQHWRAA